MTLTSDLAQAALDVIRCRPATSVQGQVCCSITLVCKARDVIDTFRKSRSAQVGRFSGSLIEAGGRLEWRKFVEMWRHVRVHETAEEEAAWRTTTRSDGNLWDVDTLWRETRITTHVLILHVSVNCRMWRHSFKPSRAIFLISLRLFANQLEMIWAVTISRSSSGLPAKNKKSIVYPIRV